MDDLGGELSLHPNMDSMTTTGTVTLLQCMSLFLRQTASVEILDAIAYPFPRLRPNRRSTLTLAAQTSCGCAPCGPVSTEIQRP